jgi:hypothetical protein
MPFPFLALIPAAMSAKQAKDKSAQQAADEVPSAAMQQRIAAAAQQKLRNKLTTESSDG